MSVKGVPGHQQVLYWSGLFGIFCVAAQESVDTSKILFTREWLQYQFSNICDGYFLLYIFVKYVQVVNKAIFLLEIFVVL